MNEEVIGLKICFIVNKMNVVGGVQRVLYSIVKELQRDNNVCICTFMNSTDKVCYQYSDNVEFQFMGEYYERRNLFTRILRKICRKFGIVINKKLTINAFYNKKNKKNLQEILEDKQFDVVIALQGTNSILLGQIVHLKLKKTKFYGWMHSSYEAYFETPNAYNYGEYKIAKESLPKLDGIITLTEHDAIKYHENFGVNAVCINNPLSFEPQKIANMSQKHLLFVGRMMLKTKGIDYLIEILKEVFMDIRTEEWDCLIVGDGPDFEKTKNLAKRAGIYNRLKFLGNVTDVEKIYTESSILLSTSRWEGFGLVITEAYACGVPVVAFNNSGPAEIINNGIDGILIEKYDVHTFAQAVIELIVNEEKRKEYSVNALIRSQDFKVDSIMKRWEAVLNNS